MPPDQQSSGTKSIVVGEIGGAFTGEGTVEIGYAIVKSHWGRRIATDSQSMTQL